MSKHYAFKSTSPNGDEHLVLHDEDGLFPAEGLDGVAFLQGFLQMVEENPGPRPNTVVAPQGEVVELYEFTLSPVEFDDE